MLLTTLTGRNIDVLHLRQEDIHILDIAHALSNLCRFGGHSRTFYSVAQHSCRIAQELPRHLRFVGLMHDAAEAYVLDMPSPLKKRLPHYRMMETAVWKSLCERYALPEGLPPDVLAMDHRALMTEYMELMPGEVPDGLRTKGLEPLPYQPPMNPSTARDVFLAMFAVYSKAPR